ncbi:6,7-dimethyl-8-ribityllumazine synthase [Candidatus Nomurabacteria bacterium RIFCSPLOWO2_02_FULL_42_17]|uniref:6,7-dimethyl-8-ribityllumazine synthase n=2 Tax=Patescibacteria group TaxID=1783273 RepID=A0A1F6XQ60_9BACT|nr:MAG: 6,7-dimethyl-8-ribityllumazine synthase [Parcubacteria group bacterium GW2011_GWA2_42_18]OGI96223.1 MAG: 6,7-dimethyl-8-ribityllumazine synthase [Candidatus Nomurabacteria bacterium RIFCSPLOWO2_02_FULL_42_17]
MQINKKLPKFDARLMKVGLVVARFNSEITEKLLASALRALKEYKVLDKNIAIVSVAGSMELPYALQKMVKIRHFNALIALGCIIRGDTPHFDYVAKTAQEGALRVSLDHDIPIGFGVLTVNTPAQARKRLHVGGEATVAALDLARLKI